MATIRTAQDFSFQLNFGFNSRIQKSVTTSSRPVNQTTPHSFLQGKSPSGTGNQEMFFKRNKKKKSDRNKPSALKIQDAGQVEQRNIHLNSPKTPKPSPPLSFTKRIKDASPSPQFFSNPSAGHLVTSENKSEQEIQNKTLLNHYEQPTITSSSDSDSISTQDALQLISKGIKLDHTDMFAPPPTPGSISAVSYLTPNSGSNRSFSNSSENIRVNRSFDNLKKSKNKAKDLQRNVSVHRSTPNLVGAKDPARKNDKVTFFKRISRIKFGSEPSLDEVIDPESKAQFGSPALLNSMKVKNQTVLNLQRTKSTRKRDQKQKRQERRQQEKELQEYYKTHEVKAPQVPPAFLLNPELNKLVSDEVLTKAEKSFPQTVKRYSMAPSHLGLIAPSSTPVSDLSKSSTIKRLSLPNDLTGGLPTAKSTIRRSSMPIRRGMYDILEENTNSEHKHKRNSVAISTANSIPHSLSQTQDSSNNFSVPKQELQSSNPEILKYNPPVHHQITSEKRAEGRGTQQDQRYSLLVSNVTSTELPQPLEPEMYPEYADYNNYHPYYDNGYRPSDLYTLSEKSFDQSHSREPSQDVKTIPEPVDVPIPLSQNVYRQAGESEQATYLYDHGKPKSDYVNAPVLVDYSSSGSVHSLDYYSASSGSTGDIIASKSTEMSGDFLVDRPKVINVDLNDGDYSTLMDDVVRLNSAEFVPSTLAYPDNEIVPEPRYAPPPIPLRSTPEMPSYPAPTAPEPSPASELETEVIGMKKNMPNSKISGHYYKNLVRMDSNKSFLSTKVRINFNPNVSDSDY